MDRTILLPIDLSDRTSWEKPLAEALSMLGPQGVLHVVSVFPDFGIPQVGSFFEPGYERAALHAFGEALTQWMAENVPDRVDVHPHVLHGSIYDEILGAARKLGVDLIVIGAHRPALKDYLLGPNAARVVRHAAQSVYVVRG